MKSQSPPVMSIAFLHPVLDAMSAQGCGTDLLARQLSISVLQMQDPATMLPAGRVYAFLAWSTVQIGDPFLCARIGQRMANGGWGPINALLSECATVWEFLRRFSVTAEDQGGAATYRLEIEGRIALWKLGRPKGVRDCVRFADAIATSFFVELLKQSQGAAANWDDCIAMTSDASLVPDDILPRANVISGAKGTTLRFPSGWLERDLGDVRHLSDTPEVGLPEMGIVDLAERVRHLLGLHLSDPEFGIEKVATSIGIPKWKLQRALRNANTSVAEIRNDLRLDKARDLLTSDKRSVSEIAAELGYSSPSNFSRAYRAKTGQSPIAYRTRHRSRTRKTQASA